MSRKQRIISSINKLVSSDKFFVGIITLFIIQAGWIALSSNYPMAFDEDFHLGLINLYSQHLVPFWSSHPATGNAYGALTRDPSYLYHYGFGFLYLIIKELVHNLTAQILILRFINVALFASGLYLFRKLLLQTRASKAIVHYTLLIFVLIPVVPLLGAQINYDNLIFPLTALTLLLTISFVRSMKESSMNVARGLMLLVVCMIASLVKYAFLPVFVAVVIYCLFKLKSNYSSVKNVSNSFKKGWRSAKTIHKWTLLVVLIIFSALMVERYAVNVAKYHKPVPDCAQVLSYDNCKYYGPWIRDYNFSKDKIPGVDTSPIAYSTRWGYGMWLRNFFSVGGKISDYQSRGPLFMPSIAGAIFIVSGFIALCFYYRRIKNIYDKSVIQLFVLTIALSVIILWFTQYQLFTQTYQPVAINGRYLYPILPMLMLLIVMAYDQFLRKSVTIKYLFATALLICFMWGGGALTYVLRSENSWYWSNSPTTPVNQFIKRNIGPITPGYNSPTEFLRKV